MSHDANYDVRVCTRSKVSPPAQRVCICTSNDSVGEGGAPEQDVHSIAVSKEHTMCFSRLTELQIERVKPVYDEGVEYMLCMISSVRVMLRLVHTSQGSEQS